MRWNGFLLASVFVVVTLSGCSDSDDDEGDELTALDCPDVGLDGLDVGGDASADGNGSDDGALDDLNGTLALLRARQANETGAPDNDSAEEVLETTAHDDHGDGCPEPMDSTPNVPPVAALTMTADDGIVQDGTTFLLAGQNVTFSAAGSSDDGSVQLAALTVRDGNGTRTVQLFEDGFQDATLSFPHEGPANVTLRVLDDDGEVDILEAMLYVNRVHSVSVPVDAFLPEGADAGSCDYPAEPPLVWQRAMGYAHFVVNGGARWLSAEMTGGSGEFALCDPDKEPLTEASSGTAETDRAAGPLPSSPQYAVFGVATGGASALTFDVMVHYEP